MLSAVTAFTLKDTLRYFTGRAWKRAALCHQVVQSQRQCALHCCRFPGEMRQANGRKVLLAAAEREEPAELQLSSKPRSHTDLWRPLCHFEPRGDSLLAATHLATMASWLLMVWVCSAAHSSSAEHLLSRHIFATTRPNVTNACPSEAICLAQATSCSLL